MNDQPYVSTHSRRDFFTKAFGAVLAGASVIEASFLRAAWARAQAPQPSTNLFTIEKVAEGVYAALARPQIMINGNAAIFVNSQDVLVVDACSKPSAAAALIAQIRREVTTKPVRYLVYSHFHFDHTQGASAYTAGGAKVDIIASETTKQLMSQFSRDRLKDTLDSVPPQIDDLRARAAKTKSASDQEGYRELIRQLQAYQVEMKNYTLELPTISFDKSFTIKDKAGDLHIEFHGRAHTAGDVVTFSPAKRVVATGDVIIGILPNMRTAYPKLWPIAIDSIGQLGFDKIICGHGPVQQGRERMILMRNYIVELTERVEMGKNAGQSVAELQKSIMLSSLKSLQANGYADYVSDNVLKTNIYLGQKPWLEARLSDNIDGIYHNLDLS